MLKIDFLFILYSTIWKARVFDCKNINIYLFFLKCFSISDCNIIKKLGKN